MGARKNRHGRRNAKEQAQGDKYDVSKEEWSVCLSVNETCKVVLSDDMLVEHAVELALNTDGSKYLISLWNGPEPVEVTNALTGELVCELAMQAFDVVGTARSWISKEEKVSVDLLKLVNKTFGVLRDSDQIYAINATECVPDLSPTSPQKVIIMEWRGKELAAVIAALLSETAKLAGHATGCLVVQALYESADWAIKRNLMEKLSGHIYNLSMNPYGCRVIQMFLTVSPKDIQGLIAKELVGHVAECIESRHGNHVIQKCLEQMPPDSIAFIFKEVEDQFERMAKHRYGCRVIQRFMENTRPPVGIMHRILAAAHELATDRFGNYVVQHVLTHCDLEETRALLKLVAAHFESMAQDKYASNFVEKSFECVSVGHLAPQLEVERGVLFAAAFDMLDNIVLDGYGNYVVQRMIECSRGEERSELFARLNLLRPLLQSTSLRTAKSILEELEKET